MHVHVHVYVHAVHVHGRAKAMAQVYMYMMCRQHILSIARQQENAFKIFLSSSLSKVFNEISTTKTYPLRDND